MNNNYLIGILCLILKTCFRLLECLYRTDTNFCKLVGEKIITRIITYINKCCVFLFNIII